MKITLNHMIYDILEIASSGSNPNEFKISNEQLSFWIEQTRAMLIGQSLNKHDDINDTCIQYINCIELEQVDSQSCCFAPSECFVLKSIKKIPSTIDTWKDNWIVSVQTMDGTSISKSNPIKQRYQKYNKYTSNLRSWMLKDNYLYIINDDVLEYASLSGIFESPSELSNFVDCSGEACFTNDSDYPVSISMANTITDIIIKTKVNPFMQFPSDDSNNANNSTPKQSIENKQSQ